MTGQHITRKQAQQAINTLLAYKQQLSDEYQTADSVIQGLRYTELKFKRKIEKRKKQLLVKSDNVDYAAKWSDFEYSARVYNCFRAANWDFDTLVADITLDELLGFKRWRNIGRKGFSEITDILTSVGITYTGE